MIRRAGFVALAAALITSIPVPALAHGIGGRADLPVPVEFFLYGAGVVLIVSFIALALLWPVPRLQGGPRPTLVTSNPIGRPGKVLAAIGLAGLLLVVVAGLFGVQNGSRNVGPVLVWVDFWLVVPFLGALFGNLYTKVNPWRTLGSMVGTDERPALLERLGVYPAALALLLFTWMELVSPDGGQPRTLAIAALVYTAYAIGLMVWAGPSTGLQIGDAFTTYNRLISAISPFGRDREGRLVRRGWIRALPVLPRWRGLTAFVVLMIGTVSYDGLSGTQWWRDLLGSDAGTVLWDTLGLLFISAVIGAGYWVASWGAVKLAGDQRRTRDVAASFAHTLVPIALAYAFAHYFTLVLFEGQLLISTLSDPFGQGWDLFGTADRAVNYWMSPTVVWYVQVAAIVVGHVTGVILAHDRALAEFPPVRAVRSQYAMLVLMVALTSLGLTILAAG
ncbi:MAG: hypothetical protein OEM81_09935 [Acidimicrobiia bacterium]|nr:hypothetical protein [Acidimicrobiia bacterium]MDH3398135.1 hypothetical protein [Acidimicrobiia bacterium]